MVRNVNLNKNITKNSPIGIFDSGFGGMSVALELCKQLPNEKFIYVGDSANFPYGVKSVEDIKQFSLRICKWFVVQGVKLIIIACNTATMASLQVAQFQMPVPVLGVIEPGARAAIKATKNNKIGVLATDATVKSGAYENILKDLKADVEVFSVGAAKLVEIAENDSYQIVCKNIDHDTNFSDHNFYNLVESNLEIAKSYTSFLVKHEVDTVITGCTHFALIMPLIKAAFPYEVNIVSSSLEVCNDAKKILKSKNLLMTSDKNICSTFNLNQFYTTGDNVDKYKEFGSFIFKKEIQNVKQLSI